MAVSWACPRQGALPIWPAPRQCTVLRRDRGGSRGIAAASPSDVRDRARVPRPGRPRDAPQGHARQPPASASGAGMPSAGTAPSWTTAKRSVSSVTSEQPHGFAGISGLAGHEASPRLSGLRLDGGGTRLIERDRPALYRLQLPALEALSGLDGDQPVGRLCVRQGPDLGLAPIYPI